MKSFKINILLFAAAIFSGGCDELAVKNVQVPVSFKLSEKIVIPENSDPNAVSTFISGGQFDIVSLPDVADVAGTPANIKKIKIDKIKYEFSDFSGDTDAVVTGELLLPTMKMTSEINVENAAHFAIDPVKLAEASPQKEQFTIDENFDEVNEYLSKNTTLQYAFRGSSTHNPVSVNIVLTVSVLVITDVSLNL